MRADRGDGVGEKNPEYAEVAELFRRLKVLDAGSDSFRRQRAEIIDRCLPLADHIAWRFRNRGQPLDDLIQTGRVGLVGAVNRYDVDNGAGFVAFAVPTIMGEVRRYFRDCGWAVKVPRRAKELQSQLNKARDELSQRLGRAPNASEVADHLAIDRELVVEATIAASNYFTLSTDAQAAQEGENRAIGETLGDLDPGLDKVLNVETVRPLIAALPERQRAALTLRFFENKSQTDIAEHLDCSQMHASRLLARALETLRGQVRAADLAAAG
jgi:RNA polymerase sigma-B factor